MSKHRETGCLIERSPGHWAIVISVRDPASSKRKRQWHSFTGNKKEAQAERIRLLAARQNGTAIDPRKMKLAKYLEDWLRTIKESVSPRTYERYAEIVDKYLVPALGETVLSKLDKFVIGDAYVSDQGKADQGRGGAIRSHSPSLSSGLERSPSASRPAPSALQPRSRCETAQGGGPQGDHLQPHPIG
jgi:Phage integrase, N-terminal SAM-like domain